MRIPQCNAISLRLDPIDTIFKESEGRDDDEPDGRRVSSLPQVRFNRIANLFYKYLSGGSGLPRNRCRIAKSGLPAFATSEAFWLCLRE